MQVFKRRPRLSTSALVQIGLVGGLIAMAILGYFLSSGFRTGVRDAFSMLSRGDVDALRDYILSFGAWAPIMSLLLMVLQAIAAPIPGFLVILANGLAFGVFWGGLLSLVGQTLAAVVCFGIARLLGRKPVELLAGKLGLSATDGWVARRGFYGVLLARLIPGMAFDAISYAAGLTNMGFWRFSIATAIGATPQVFVYAYLGQNAARYVWPMLGVTIVVIGGAAALAFVRGRRQIQPGRAAVSLGATFSQNDDNLTITSD